MRAPAWLAMWIMVTMFGVVPIAAADGHPDAIRSVAHFQRAMAIQTSTREQLRVLGDAFTCDEARFVTYRRSDVEPEFADQWYVASQLWADAELLFAERTLPSELTRLVRRSAAGQSPGPTTWIGTLEGHCHLTKGFIFLDRLWDHDAGGYHARSDPTGQRVAWGPRFGDDNALAGLALLAAMGTTHDERLRIQYRHAARRESAFMMSGGLWDETFGGGFWWNTDRGNTDEGKPAQTNALAALFFARMYQVTGEEIYRTWALKTLLWLDTVLYDPERQLYRRSVRYETPAERAGPAVSEPRYFNYDQGLAIEAQLNVSELDGDPGRLVRAQQVGLAMHDAFWGEDRGGYNLEAGVEQVYTSYAAWTSLGHLALHDVDGNRMWLSFAEANAGALASAVREPDSSYALRHYRCVDLIALGCESGEISWVIDHTIDTAAQAWTQHLNVALGRRLAAISGHGFSPSAVQRTGHAQPGQS